MVTSAADDAHDSPRTKAAHAVSKLARSHAAHQQAIAAVGGIEPLVAVLRGGHASLSVSGAALGYDTVSMDSSATVIEAMRAAGLIRGALSGHIAWSNASPTSRNPTSIWPSFAPRATALLVTSRRLGVVASVGVEVTDLPACQFTIRIQV